MGKVTRFEDLKCWQKARELVDNIYSISNSGQLSKDFGLKDQLRRASVSSMTNIAEGFARYHRKEFIRFLDFAQSSASEVKSLLYVVHDQKYLQEEQVEFLQKKAEEVRALTLGLLKYVNGSLPANKVNDLTVGYNTLEDFQEISKDFFNKTLSHSNT